MMNRIPYDNSNVTFLSPDQCSCHQDHPKVHYLLVEILQFHKGNVYKIDIQDFSNLFNVKRLLISSISRGVLIMLGSRQVPNLQDNPMHYQYVHI